MPSIHLAAAIVLLSSAAAQAADLSGTYVGTGQGSVFLVEIVDTGGHVTGRYEQQVLKSGAIDDMNAALSGAESNGTLVLNLRPNGLLTGVVTLSGTGDGQSLTLAGGGFDLHLVRSSDAGWAAQVSSLSAQAKADNDRAAETAALGRLEAFVQSLDDFTTRADEALAALPKAEARLRSITAGMRTGLDRERATGNGVARGQIDVAIHQAAIGGSQIWDTVQSAWQDFQTRKGELASQTGGIRQLCDGVLAGTISNGDAAHAPRWSGDCKHALQSITAFDEKVAVLLTAFQRINDLWRTEGTAQNGIVEAADAAED